MNRIEIELTRPQADWAEWAIGGMDLMDEEWEEFGYAPNDIPVLLGTTLILKLKNLEDVVADLLWRLRDQVPLMAAHDPDAHPSEVRCAANLADKIERAT